MYSFLRVYLIPLAFISWLVYELLIKKKRFSEIKNDLIVISCFLIIWIIIFFLLLS
jgi:hypothetical protein